jgi:hypothetical protein
LQAAQSFALGLKGNRQSSVNCSLTFLFVP